MAIQSTHVNSANVIPMQELGNFLKQNIQTLHSDPSLADSLPPVMIWGSPGLGKSTIVKTVAKELGIEFRDIRLAQIESVDIRGLPSVDKENGTMKWNAPDFWPRDPESKGIIFLDEISACPKDVAVAAYQLILDRKLGDFYEVPKGWYIVAAGNKTTDRAVSMTMSSALANRFLHVEVEADAEEWCVWAYRNDVHPAVTGFIKYRPNLIFNMTDENLERGWPSPRAWEKVSTMSKIYSGNIDLLRKIVYGLIGNHAGIEFVEYFKMASKFDDVLDMLLGKKPISVPTKSDEKYALASAVIYHAWKGKDEKESLARLSGVFKIANEMTADFAAMMICAVANGTNTISKGDAIKTLCKCPEWKEFSKKHGSVIRKYMI
jgi:hypothetical protein